MKFEEAVAFTLIEEGGAAISTNKKDPGGITKYGISQRAYPHLDIKNLTEKAAIELYREDYWDVLECESLPPAIRLNVFECAVNQGVNAAAGLLQAALGISIDGVVGPKTIKAANEADISKLIEVFSRSRHLRYMMNPRFPVFGGGWTNRLLKVTIRSYQELIRKPS